MRTSAHAANRPSWSWTTRSRRRSHSGRCRSGRTSCYHSATKYLAGHSDTVNGVLATIREDLFDRLRFLQNAIGAVPGPFDCFLVLRGLRTLECACQRHSSNGLAVAQRAGGARRRRRRALPRAGGRAASRIPRQRSRRARCAASGGMVSFQPAAARMVGAPRSVPSRFCEATRVFAIAESLGGVESLIEMPFGMTHGAVQGSPLEVPRALIRLSVGIEDPADLVADLTQALDAR